MRNPKRIDKVLGTIEKVWRKSPDMRLMQLLGNVLPDEDNYFIEDERLLSNLQEAYAMILNENKKCGTGKDIRKKSNCKCKSTRV